MAGGRDYIKQIEEMNARAALPDLDDGITKLLSICTRLTKLNEQAEETAYFLVASIAAIETYFRWEIRNLIDSDDQRFINNLRLHESVKITHEMLVAVYGKRITVGDLVANSSTLSGLDAINKTMSELLQTNFMDRIKNATAGEGGSVSSAGLSFDGIAANVARTFKLRHIICHEAHVHDTIDLDEIKLLCSSCYSFLVASRNAILDYVYPNRPRTIGDAADAARGRIVALGSNIAAAESQIISDLHGMEEAAFRSMQLAWKAYADAAATFSASLHMNGNRGELFAQLSTEQLYKDRLSELNAYIRNRTRLASPRL